MFNDNANDSRMQSNSKSTIQKPIRAASRDTWGIEAFKLECIQEMASNGCPFPNTKDIKTDGNLHRYSRDSKQNEPDEWYKAYENFSTDNVTAHSQTHLIVVYGSWSEGSKYTYYSWKNDPSYSREYLKQLNEDRIKKSKEADAELQKKRDLEAKDAVQIWDKASLKAPDDSYKTYINKKGVDPLGIKYGKNPSGFPSIIIPFRNNAGEIRALEYISVGDDGKKYSRCFGGRAGNFHIVDNKTIKNGDPIIVAEGWATAVSIFMAVGGIVCAVGGSNNIENVLENIHQAYPESPITIASDKGKGEECAYESAKKFAAKIVIPVFPKEKTFDNQKNKPYTDFNDLHVAISIDEVRRQILSNVETVKSHAEELQVLAKSILTKSDPCEDFSTNSLPPILKDYVNNICKTTDAHPLVVTCSALAAMSVFLNTNVCLPFGEYYQDLYPNIWILTISKSGFFKSTAMSRGGALAYAKNFEHLTAAKAEERKKEKANDEEKKVIDEQIRQHKLKTTIVPSDITPEAFIKYLSDGHIGVLFHNEFGGFVQSTNENGLMQTLTDLYDMPRGWRKLTKTQGDDIIELPFFSICGVSTLSWLQNSLVKENKRDVHGGFFARFLIFTPPIKDVVPQGLPEKNKILDTESIRIKETYENTINSISIDIKAEPRIFSISDDARKIFSDPINKNGIHEIMYEMINKNYNDQTKEILSSFVKRWSPYILKIAMLMELLYDKNSNTITERSLNAAANLVFPAIKSTAMLFESVLGASEIQRKCKRVLEYIAKKGGTVTRGQLIKNEVLPDANAKQYDEVLELLIVRGDIEGSLTSKTKETRYTLKTQNSDI